MLLDVGEVVFDGLKRAPVLVKTGICAVHDSTKVQP